jgi:hypothetical protein
MQTNPCGIGPRGLEIVALSGDVANPRGEPREELTAMGLVSIDAEDGLTLDPEIWRGLAAAMKAVFLFVNVSR